METQQNSFESVFGKAAKSTILEFKAMAQQMISNQCDFSCQCLNITATNGEDTIYPESSDLSKWIQNLLKSELKSKPLNPKALEEMAKKGVKPKKQPNEIILVAIIPSLTHIHVGVSVPDNSPVAADDFISSALQKYMTLYESDLDGKYAFMNIQHGEALKERDAVLQCFFNELKLRKIYIEDEEDDGVMVYEE
jgi:hypothetical protein